MKIAITIPGGSKNPNIWSGTPYSLHQALSALGHEPLSVDVAPHAKLGSAAIRIIKIVNRKQPLTTTQIRQSKSYNALFSLIGSLKVLFARPDVVLQVGTGYTIHTTKPLTTFEDMTIQQAITGGWDEGWHDMPEKITAERLKIQKQNYLKAHRIAVATDWVKESIVKDYGISSEKVAVVGLGSEKIPRLAPENKDWSKPVFLFVGKDWERKNGPLVVETFTKIREYFSDAELHLVGGHPTLNLPGVIEHGLLDATSESDQKKLQELYAKATCLVVPSVFEPAGLVYVEAGRSGVSSIGTKNGGSSFMIGDGGITVDPTSVADVESAMKKLSDSSTSRELAEKAFTHSEWFTWKKVAQRIVELF